MAGGVYQRGEKGRKGLLKSRQLQGFRGCMRWWMAGRETPLIFWTVLTTTVSTLGSHGQRLRISCSTWWDSRSLYCRRWWRFEGEAGFLQVLSTLRDQLLTLHHSLSFPSPFPMMTHCCSWVNCSVITNLLMWFELYFAAQSCGSMWTEYTALGKCGVLEVVLLSLTDWQKSPS